MIQVTLTGVLVIITGLYVWRTFVISRSAGRQANASMIMANEMRRQTNTLKETVSLSVRPSISVSIVGMPQDHTYPFAPPHEISFAIANGGKGPARNVTLTCEGQGKKVEYSKRELPSLEAGDTKTFTLTRTTPIENEEIRIAYLLFMADYNDELEDMWRATLQIDKNDDWKPGDFSIERLNGGDK